MSNEVTSTTRIFETAFVILVVFFLEERNDNVWIF